jgi:hypothetical protein
VSHDGAACPPSRAKTKAAIQISPNRRDVAEFYWHSWARQQ